MSTLVSQVVGMAALGAAGRRGRPVMHLVVWALLIVACLLPAGCAGGQEGLVTIKLVGTKPEQVHCYSFLRGEVFAALKAEGARKADEDRYGFRAFAGELLTVELPGGPDKSDAEMSFPYVFRGDEKMPLVWSRRPGLGLLNGKVVCVDLGTKAGAGWVARQSDGELRKVRTLLLGPDVVATAKVLRRLQASGITVGSSDSAEIESGNADSAAVAEERAALIAAKPACLVVGEAVLDKADKDMLGQLSDLTHLVMPWRGMIDLTKLKKLRYLGLHDETKNLAPLAKLPQLQGLWLEECDKVTDFGPLRELNRLQLLSIGNASNGGGPADLGFLADMRELRSLILGLGEGSRIKSIAPVGKLTNLTELAISPMPPGVKDLSPLTKLKNLKMLVVDSDSLKDRSEEYDELRKAMPDCEIVGFCMGSAWILLLIPAAVGLGFLRRRAAGAKVA